LQRPRDAHAAARDPATLDQFVQTGVGRFGNRLEQQRFCVAADDALPAAATRQRLDGTGFAPSPQQIVQPSFRNLESLGEFSLRSLVGEIRLNNPSAQIHRVSFHAWPPCRGQVYTVTPNTQT
jgi:hypothetical protein